MTIEKTSFAGWDNCYRMTNGEVELIAVAEIGPRILRFGYVDGQNIFFVDKETQGQTGGEEWKAFGGHRLWAAPEHEVSTYYPDNFPVHAEVDGNTLRLISVPEIYDRELREGTTYEQFQKQLLSLDFRGKVGIQKNISITLQEDGEVILDHEIVNQGLIPVELAPWTLTVMNAGGLGILPNPPYAPHGPGHFLPVRSLILWSYTDLTDPRLKFTEDFVTIKQDPNATKPFKLAFSDTGGWTAYALNDNLFVKHLEYNPKETYTDMGSSVEVFTNASMMEVESLGPLATLKPGQSVIHRERWTLHKIGPVEQSNESVKSVIEALDLSAK